MLRIADTFIVERPRTVDDALVLLSQYGESARIVAGGTDIIPNIKHGLHAPEVLVDIKGIETMRHVDLSGDVLKLGALVPIHTLATHSGLRSVLPALAEAASAIAGPQLRRMGTLGGNVCLDTRCVYINQTHFWRQSLGYCLKKDGTQCHVVVTGKRCVAAASNDTAPVLMTLDAQLELISPRGTRLVGLDEFYVNDGVKNNQIASDELLVGVHVPRPDASRAMAYQKLRIRGAIDFPMLNLGLSYLKDGETIRDIQLVFSAIAARPRRIKNLPEGPLDEGLIEQIAQLAFKRIRPLTNINGDVVWRREMAPVLVRRAFESAQYSA
ncbi:MAG: FAD binding domain-containing protein [Myxococcota bacterium]|nr:FAD binding domain-containing protein [Myxococcota bacterium]